MFKPIAAPKPLSKIKLSRCCTALSLAFFLGFTAHAQSGLTIETRISRLMAKMTLEEKVSMIHGNTAFSTSSIKRLGIPALTMSDGPHGVNYERPLDWSTSRPPSLDSGTYLPVGICLASTWNKALAYQYGAVLGSEAAYRKKDVILGPGINIIRTPLNGRNFEYESEDPFLISKIAVNYIKGVQSQGVAACVKHFAANNQETLRGSINVEMSERALREIYLPGFKAAVQEAKVKAVMGAYNQFRGEYCSHNNYLVNEVLKKEWGFKGVLISDWGAVHSTTQALKNGCDIEMGTELATLPLINYHKFFMADTAVALVKAGKVSISLIDDKVRRVLRIMFETKMIGGKRPIGEYNSRQHQLTALKVAEEGIVLLKNEGKLLPLNTKKISSMAVIGSNSNRLQAFGGGSSQVKAFYEVSPFQGIKNHVGAGVKISYAKGYNDDRGGLANDSLIREAVLLAHSVDAVVFVGGWSHGYDYRKWEDSAFDTEGTDKQNLEMPFGQNKLIVALQKANPNLVIVLIGGGPVDMTQWVNESKAIIQAWYPGMEGGNAIANVIFGNVNPSGKLPITFPKSLEDAPASKIGQYPGNGINVVYKDDIYVGYRYFDTYKVKPQFAFGHGLSYTEFTYSRPIIKKMGNNKFRLSFTVSNTGKVAGAEVAQVYIRQLKSFLPRPEKELKAFEKVYLQPNESKTVNVFLDKGAFEYYNDKLYKWVTEKGFYEIKIGGASDAVVLSKTISL